MTPRVDLVLKSLVTELEQMAPVIQPAYSSAQLVFMSRLLLAAAESWDCAASMLVEENRAIRQLLRETLPLVDDVGLVDRMNAAIETQDDDLRISTLQAFNEDLRHVLTALHAVVELIDSDAGRTANEAIWRELSASVIRRRRSSDMFPLTSIQSSFKSKETFPC